VIEQEALDGSVAVLAGRQEGRPAAVLAGVGIGAGGQQQAHRLDVAAGDGRVQGLHVHGVAGHRPGVGPRVQEHGRRVGLTEEGGEVQRREPVARPGVDPVGFLREQLAEAVDAAEGGGVEDVELRLRLQHRRDQVRPVAVAGGEDGRDTALVAAGGQRRIGAQQGPQLLDVARRDCVEEIHIGSLSIYVVTGNA